MSTTFPKFSNFGKVEKRGNQNLENAIRKNHITH